MSSYYSVLGIEKNATEKDLKKSYRTKLLLLHPDKQNQRKDNNRPLRGTVDNLQLVREAYQILIDPIKRANYDKSLNTKSGNNNLGAELASGLETVSLDDFDFNEDSVMWLRDCPRCNSKKSFEISENDLVRNISLCEGIPDDFDGAYNLVIQCNSCSLWLRVKYYDLDEDDE